MRTFDLAPLYRSTVGFDRLFSMLDGSEAAPGYPPYNIERTADNDYRVTVAVAGFAENELSIESKENTLTIKGAKQAVQMFGPAQAAVAKAVADSVAAGVIPQSDAENLVIVCGVFIHWQAADDKKIYQYNYEATMAAISNAMHGKPTVTEMLAGKDSAAHPFRGC